MAKRYPVIVPPLDESPTVEALRHQLERIEEDRRRVSQQERDEAEAKRLRQQIRDLGETPCA
jgi:hypothetical protein